MSPRPPYRIDRVNTVLQQQLAQTLATRMRDPRLGFVTVTSVQVTPDLSHAVVRVSVMGSDEEKQATLAALDHARGFLRSELARTVQIRTVPDLRFELDRGLENAARIDRLLKDAKKGNPQP